MSIACADVELSTAAEGERRGGLCGATRCLPGSYFHCNTGKSCDGDVRSDDLYGGHCSDGADRLSGCCWDRLRAQRGARGGRCVTMGREQVLTKNGEVEV